MKVRLTLLRGIAVALALAGGAAQGLAGTATNVEGLYYTGDQSDSSTLQTQGSKDGNWSVTYASVDGRTYTGNSQYTGSAYVVTDSQISGSSYIQDTSQAQWITAPGASTSTSGGSTNQGGLFLPGNGTSGKNESVFIYTLAFTISGTGSGTVSNEVALSLTIAADDNYSVFVNPTTNNGRTTDTGNALPTSAASTSGSAAWGNTTSISLANYNDATDGFTDNANFVIGTNYLEIEVVNSNGVNGSSTATDLNASGLLVYQVGNVGFINGKPIPEMNPWLPTALAALLGGFVLWRRRRSAPV